MERKAYVIPIQGGGTGIGFQTPTVIYTEEHNTFNNVLQTTSLLNEKYANTDIFPLKPVRCTWLRNSFQ